MAFPGIISRLHPVSSTEELAQQRLQGEQYRAEAFWLPALMSSHASELLAALPESCSLFLEQACPDLALRSHDGTLHNNEQLITVNGQTIALATTRVMVVWCPNRACARWPTGWRRDTATSSVQLQFSLWLAPSSTSGPLTPIWPDIS